VVGLVRGSTGDQTAAYEYDPFGRTIRITGVFAQSNPFRFSTKRANDTCDLVLYERRIYSPSSGRWLSRDSIGENGGVNLYGMVGNNPIRYVDRLGLAPAKACSEAIGKSGKPRIVFEPSPPTGGWKGRISFGYGGGSSVDQELDTIEITWKASVVVLCKCTCNYQIRPGTRVFEDIEAGHWLTADPTSLPMSPFPVATEILVILGDQIAGELAGMLASVPIMANDDLQKQVNLTIANMIRRRPTSPQDGTWEGGVSPCDK
jgi:RHS repeat-associated protein